MRGDRTMFLFTFADEDATGSDSPAAQKALLRKRFENSGWECPQILDALDAGDDLYFDRVSQIRWIRKGTVDAGRVTLVGDAASCVSLLAGQGSALAMVAAYILAGELRRATAIMPKLLSDTRICSGRSFSRSRRPHFVLPVHLRPSRGSHCLCAIRSSISWQSPGSRILLSDATRRQHRAPRLLITPQFPGSFKPKEPMAERNPTLSRRLGHPAVQRPPSLVVRRDQVCEGLFLK